jgi:hypothetical protein
MHKTNIKLCPSATALVRFRRRDTWNRESFGREDETPISGSTVSSSDWEDLITRLVSDRDLLDFFLIIKSF